MSTTAAGRGPRPPVITLLVVLAYIEAALSAIVGIILLVRRGGSGFQADVGYGSSDIFTFGIVALIHAVLIAFVAYYLWQGSDLARIVTAVLACFAIAGYLFTLIQLRTPIAESIIGLVFWGVILWVLYGYEPSRRFFGDEDAPPPMALA